MHFIPVLFSYSFQTQRNQIRTHLCLTCCLNLQGSPPPPRKIVITRSRVLLCQHGCHWARCLRLSTSKYDWDRSVHVIMDYGLWTPWYTYSIYLSVFMFKACPPLTAHSWQSCKACWTLPPSLLGRSRHFHPAIFSNIFKYWNIFMQIFNQNYVVCLSPCHKVWRPNAAFLQLQ